MSHRNVHLSETCRLRLARSSLRRPLVSRGASSGHSRTVSEKVDSSRTRVDVWIFASEMPGRVRSSGLPRGKFPRRSG